MGRTRQGHARSRLAHCKMQQEQAHQGIETDMCSMKLESSVTVAQIDDFEDVIDVRSPGEYALDHVPSAVSHPVLGDEERARVGTLYKQVSPFEARKVGAALMARNIALHIEQSFSAKPQNWRPLVYCWRGGKRSGSLAFMLREIGWRAATLQGGYQEFRRAVVADLETLPREFAYRVVCGPTGSAKSRLLEALAARGAQVLDLEALARHRGSVLGALPGDPQPSQKAFETSLWQALRRLDRARPVFVEAESRKIGNLQLPNAMIECMRAGQGLRVEPPLAERVRFLIVEYRHLLEQPALLKARLQQLLRLQPREVIDHWMDCIDRQAWAELTTDLLEKHYDPLYRKSMYNNYLRGNEPVLQPDSLASDALADCAARVLDQGNALAA
jgi:tRNA 2-selenouridine synthase